MRTLKTEPWTAFSEAGKGQTLSSVPRTTPLQSTPGMGQSLVNTQTAQCQGQCQNPLLY